jgi:hypothetical protein
MILGPVCVRYVCLSALIIHKSRIHMHNHNIHIFMMHSLPYIFVCYLLLFGDICISPSRLFVFDLSI